MTDAAEKYDDGILESESFEELEDEEAIEGAPAKDTIMRNYLRLLTWSELVEIASVFDATSMTPLTDFLTKDLLSSKSKGRNEEKIEKENGKAKILPFRQEEETKDEYDFDKFDDELEDIEEKHVIQVNKNGDFSIYDKEEEIKKKKKELKKVNIGEFVLRQKKKFSKCQKKLKKKEIYLLYKNHSSVDVSSSKKVDEKNKGMTTVSNSGLLVNKRQK